MRFTLTAVVCIAMISARDARVVHILLLYQYCIKEVPLSTTHYIPKTVFEVQCRRKLTEQVDSISDAERRGVI